MGITTERVTMFEMAPITATTTSTGGNYGNENDWSGPYVPRQNWEVAIGIVEVV